VARRGVGRTEVDDDLVPPPKYLERRGTVVVARPVLGCFWAVAWAALVGPCWAAAAGKPFSIFFSVFFFFLFSVFEFYFNSNLNPFVFLQVFNNWNFMKTNKKNILILNCF
jgi:hypothetical protein